MTVEAQTAAGLKRASSVMQIIAARFAFQTSESGKGHGKLLGEAVAVDLPDGPIFVLLKLPDSKGELGGYVTEALAGSERFATFADYFAAVQKLGGWFSGARADLPREHWPIMVRFTDARDPKTVEVVDPDAVGVKLIHLETTGSEITRGIRMRLPWLGRYAEPSLNPDHGPNDWSIGATTHQGDFISG